MDDVLEALRFLGHSQIRLRGGNWKSLSEANGALGRDRRGRGPERRSGEPGEEGTGEGLRQRRRKNRGEQRAREEESPLASRPSSSRPSSVGERRACSHRTEVVLPHTKAVAAQRLSCRAGAPRKPRHLAGGTARHFDLERAPTRKSPNASEPQRERPPTGRFVGPRKTF